MEEKETSSKQVASIQELTERIDRLEKNEQETWDMLGQLIDYINVTAEERKTQLAQLIKDNNESKLAERYNTTELQQHRSNREVHYSDKKSIKGVLE